MRTFIAWIFFFYNCILYMLHRLRLRGPINLRDYTAWWDVWLGSVFGWKRNLRIRGMENCPQQDPIIIIGNHVKLEDPFCYWVAVHRATGGKVSTHFLMRDDFFQGKPWDMLPFDVDEIARFGGAFPISRDKFSLAQLRPIINILCVPASICMFPGRTRTRSGLLIEYPEGLEEPGSPAFLMAQAQRKIPDLQVALLPVCRTWNPVTRTSVMNIGAPRYLPPGADRAAQRALDEQSLLHVAQLIEVHVPHIVALCLYLTAHHVPDVPIRITTLGKIVTDILNAVPHPYLDPAITPDGVSSLIHKALCYFQQAVMLRIDGETLLLNADKIRHVPDMTPRFRKENPVQFLVNQVLHLSELCRQAEEAILQSLSMDKRIER